MAIEQPQRTVDLRPAARGAKLRRWIAVGLALAVAAVTLGPAAWRPDPAGDAQLDRLLGGLVAGAVLALAYPRRRAVAAAGLIAGVAGLELAQRLAPGRDAVAADALIKIAGGLIAIAAVALADSRGGGPPVYSWRRGAVAVAGVATLVAGLAWWTLSPPAAARRALAADAALCRGARARPTIDIWDRRSASFNATLRQGDAGAGCVLSFRRQGGSWRLVAAHDRVPRAS